MVSIIGGSFILVLGGIMLVIGFLVITIGIVKVGGIGSLVIEEKVGVSWRWFIVL